MRTVAPPSLLELEAKKSIEDLSEDELKGKKVLVRCDVNVPLDGKTITDDTRIRSSIPTIEYLKDKGAIVTVCSHLGRPKDGPEDKFSLGPCAERMGELLGQTVTLAPDCIGDEVAEIVNNAKPGDVIMLENTRFYKEETKNDPEFVEKLAAPFDLYVNDAFGTAHRAHASTEGVTKFLQPSVSGFLLAKELDYLDGAVSNGEKPMAAIVGGSKVSSKITVLEALLDKCDKIIIGGGMVFTFLKAKGLEVGDSLVEDDYIETAKDVMAKAEKLGKEILLPVDIVVADKFDKDANTQIVDVDKIPAGWMGLDNGPKTTEEQREALADCKVRCLSKILSRLTFICFVPFAHPFFLSFRQSSWTDPWECLNLKSSIRELLQLSTFSLTWARRREPLLLSEEETLSLPPSKVDVPVTCPTSQLEAEPLWNFSRARSFQVLPLSMTSKQVESTRW